MPFTARLASVGVFLLALAPWCQPAPVEAGQVRFQVPSPQAPSGPAGELSVIRSYHRRLTFTQDIQRIAVGNTEVLSAELLTSRELLVLGRETGRTTLIVWFVNGASLDCIFSVQRDLSVLERAGQRVTVRRVLRGNVRDDSIDT
jgi:Flp pilus assembly secretin CpaC